MSQYITIQEGGVAKSASVNKLQTAKAGGGTVLWVPQEETELTDLNVSENGTYYASTDGYYGYASVTVSGCGTVTGTNSDGNEVVVTADEETGEIVEEVVPSHIFVETPPADTSYYSGETINPAGIVVKAYLASTDYEHAYIIWTDDDHPDGIIPIEELSFPITTATYTEDASASSDLDCGIAQPFAFGKTGYARTIEKEYDDSALNLYQEYTIVADANDVYVATIADGTGYIQWVIASAHPYRNYHLHMHSVHPNDSSRDGSSDSPDNPINLTFTHNHKTVYYTTHTLSGGINVDLESVSQLTTTYFGCNKSHVAWTMIYGDTEGTNGKQNVPVEWERPGDGRTLTDTFQIDVASTGGMPEIESESE